MNIPKKIILIAAMIIIAGGVFLVFQSREAEDSQEPTDIEKACLDSGGTVSTALCCQSTGDFPDDCAIGACGCAPEYSHQVKVCNCGEGRCFDGTKCVDFEEHLREKGMLDGAGQPEEEPKEGSEPKEEKQPEAPSSYQIENAPYYREDSFCWGASAIMLMMYQGFSDDEIQEFRTILKSGPGGPPDMFRGFSEFGVLDKVRLAYLENYSKESADFYNQQLLTNPAEQVTVLKDKEEAFEKLKELISSDILVSIVGHHGNHYMIITGYDENYIYLNDPGLDNPFFQRIDYQAEYKEKTKMSIAHFFEQWTVSGFEGGGVNFPGDGGMIWLEE